MPSFLQGRFLKKEAAEHARADEEMMRGNAPAAWNHEAKAMGYSAKSERISAKRQKEAAAWQQQASYEHSVAANCAANGDHAGVNKHGWRAHVATKRANKILGRNHVHAPYARHAPGVVPVAVPGPTVVNVTGNETIVRGPMRLVGEATSKGALHPGYGGALASAPIAGPSGPPIQTYRSGEVGSSGVTSIPSNAVMMDPVYVDDYADSYVQSQNEGYEGSYYQEGSAEGYTDQGYAYTQDGEYDEAYDEAYGETAVAPDASYAQSGITYSSSGQTGVPQPHVEEYKYDEYHIDEFGNPIDEYHYTTQEEYY